MKRFTQILFLSQSVILFLLTPNGYGGRYVVTISGSVDVGNDAGGPEFSGFYDYSGGVTGDGTYMDVTLEAASQVDTDEVVTSSEPGLVSDWALGSEETWAEINIDWVDGGTKPSRTWTFTLRTTGGAYGSASTDVFSSSGTSSAGIQCSGGAEITIYRTAECQGECTFRETAATAHDENHDPVDYLDIEGASTGWQRGTLTTDSDTDFENSWNEDDMSDRKDGSWDIKAVETFTGILNSFEGRIEAGSYSTSAVTADAANGSGGSSYADARGWGKGYITVKAQ